MQVNLLTLSKKAIDSALNKDWDKAVELNELILSKNPNDKEAKLRLGRAYIKTEKYAKAKKIFKDILKEDPINHIALKNYELASEQNKDKLSKDDVLDNTKVLIKEPGTTTQLKLTVTPKILSHLDAGEKLFLKSGKNKLTFFDLNEKYELGSICDEISRAVYYAKQDEKEVSASVIRTNADYIMILLKCKHPIFKSEKQQEKPYMKGVLDESEVELPEMEEVVEEE